MYPIKNFAVTNVTNNPSTGGTSMTVTASSSTLFPVPAVDGAFMAIVKPSSVEATSTNSEIVRVTAISGDTWTIEREQEGTTAKNIASGWDVFLGVTAGLIDGIDSDKADTVHTHAESDITDLGSYLTDITGENIGDLADVVITSVGDNDIVAYDTSTSKYINQTATEAGLAEATHTHTESDITDLGTYLTDITGESIGDLSDVGDATATSGNVLVADGDSWKSRALTESDISDLGSYMENPMTTAGDIIYGGADGVATRLGKGDDDQVLTLASGVPSWADAGGGGGPRGFTYVVALSDSRDNTGADVVCDGTDDYEDLQTAIDAVYTAGGGVVKILDGTFIQGGGRNNLRPGVSIEGSGYGTKFTRTGGREFFYEGTESCYYNYITGIRFVEGGQNASAIKDSSTGQAYMWEVYNCWFEDFVTGSAAVDYTNALYSRVHHCYFNNCKYVFVSGVGCHMEDNRMNFLTKPTTTGSQTPIVLSGANSEFNRNYWDITNINGDKGIYVSGADCSVKDNVFKGGVNCGSLIFGGQKTMVSGNHIETVNSGKYGIRLSEWGGCAINNWFDDTITGTGIWLDTDWTTAHGNICYTGGGTFIKVDASVNFNVMNNHSYGEFTGTIVSLQDGSSSNYGNCINNTSYYSSNSSPEMRIIQMENNSGGVISAGSFVIERVASTDGKEINTTTTQGDDHVIGIVPANIADATYGPVLVLGVYDGALVNGTADIAVGDFLGTYTSAGIGMQCASGDMAVAVALEAYTTDDSSGTIKVKVIPPRKVGAVV